ncbi:MAG TPA: hypothetical protein VGK38_10040 [Prolixibacteraceae bacterium]|jgi:ABC-2 type transport system ATP-binding protein
MSQNEIDIPMQGFKKSYKNNPGLTDIDFEVKTGSIFAMSNPAIHLLVCNSLPRFSEKALFVLTINTSDQAGVG